MIMGASNFHRVNASKVYVVLESYERPVLDDDLNETDEMETVSPERYEVDEFIEYAKEHFNDNKGRFSFSGSHCNENSEHELRSYPTTFLGIFNDGKQFGDVYAGVELKCFMRSAYYDGANLDWELTVTLGGGVCEGDITMDDYPYCSDMNVGMRKIQLKNINKYIDKTRTEIINHVEALFEKLSTPYLLVGTFSNGESIYQKADSKKAQFKNQLLEQGLL